MNKIISIVLISFSILSTTYATPGRLNSSWCHNSSTEWYHCHNEDGSYKNSNIDNSNKEIKESDDKYILYFWKWCSHCDTVEDFMEEKDISIEKKEIYFDSVNREDFLKVTDSFWLETAAVWVPFLYIIEDSKERYIIWDTLIIDFLEDIKEKENKNIEKKKSISTKLQKKIDKINIKLEIIYDKKPELLKKLLKQVKKVKPKLKQWTTKYIVINAIENKIEELEGKEYVEVFKSELDSLFTEFDKIKSNTFNSSFSKAKQYLEEDVYNIEWLERNSFYCWCYYSSDKIVDKDSCWFEDNWKYVTRSEKIEWEHVVPAEAFWQSFIEWREWHKVCVDSKWESYKWRKCVEKVNLTYKYMQADMYNLVPAIWSINALRSNYSFSIISWEEREFWLCDFEVDDRKAEPKEDIRWDIARIYMYMNINYPGRWVISNKNKKLFEAWNKEDPVSNNECERYKLIKSIQGNENSVLKEVCE